MMDTLATATNVDPNKEPRERVYDSIDVLHFLGHSLERMTHDTYDLVHRMKRSTRSMTEEVREQVDHFYNTF